MYSMIKMFVILYYYLFILLFITFFVYNNFLYLYYYYIYIVLYYYLKIKMFIISLTVDIWSRSRQSWVGSEEIAVFWDVLPWTTLQCGWCVRRPSQVSVTHVQRTSLLYFLVVIRVTYVQGTCTRNLHHIKCTVFIAKFAERGFSYAGPAAWNRLPESIRRTSSQVAFKWQLKTFLFCDAFNTVVWTSMNIHLNHLTFYLRTV